ncbi:hypothetical protein [Chamaesiphon polymorphus]|nr:hypothetical protein [Chamaesiphon polymorphus]
MLIQLSDNDLAQMPPKLCSELLQWLQAKQSKVFPPLTAVKETPEQLALKIDRPQPHSSVRLIKPTQAATPDAHVRLSQLFDMGLFTQNSQIRVRLKREKAQQVGYAYITTGIQISPSGTIVHNREEFDKPSPLATSINGGAVNGWEYIEIKQNGQWICLGELRKIWRSAA